MSKTCPPGVICLENFTVLAVFIIVALVALLLYKIPKNLSNNETIVINEQPKRRFGLFPSPNFSFSNIPNDVLLNPYKPPLKNNNIFDMPPPPPAIPINVSTQAVDANYRQVGILTRVGGPEMILPLMGRPLYVSRDKWNFYTMKDSNSMIKLPVTFKNRSCTNEYGCDNLYNGDIVYVEGYNATFKVTMYDNQVMQYIPYL